MVHFTYQKCLIQPPHRIHFSKIFISYSATQPSVRRWPDCHGYKTSTRPDHLVSRETRHPCCAHRVPGNHDSVPAAAVGEPGLNIRSGEDGRHDIPEPHNERDTQRHGELLYPRQASHGEGPCDPPRPGEQARTSARRGTSRFLTNCLLQPLSVGWRRFGTGGVSCTMDRRCCPSLAICAGIFSSCTQN